MECHTLFPTTLYTDIINESSRLELLKLCNNFVPRTHETLLNIKNFNSTLHSNNNLRQEINTHPVVIETFEFIKNSIKRFLKMRQQPYFEEDLNPYGFFSDMKEGAYLRKHAHRDCRFSGIIYLEIGEDVPPLVFHDPRPVIGVEPSRYQSIPVLPIYPKEGMFLLWDHWLEHEVYQKTNDNPRKSFTFNI
jgi:uncharacterized protein (TIGR02466 family)